MQGETSMKRSCDKNPHLSHTQMLVVGMGDFGGPFLFFSRWAHVPFAYLSAFRGFLRIRLLGLE